jgi:hypothetical protein
VAADDVLRSEDGWIGWAHQELRKNQSRSSSGAAAPSAPLRERWTVMKRPWKVERCIICLREPHSDDPLSQLTDAHVIPEALGGELSARFLCKRCNSEMGRVESQLPRDVVVVELVRRLRGELPEELVGRVLQHAGWFVEHEAYGRLEGRDSREGKFALRESETIRSDENIRRQIRVELDRRGMPAEHIEATVDEFEEAADGAQLEIAPGFKVTKHIDLSEVSLERTYDEPLAPRAIVLGIAYTFLAFILEERIYGEELEPVRELLRRVVERDTAAADSWPIDCLRSSSPAEAKHALAVQREDGGIVVKVWLFRELLWNVHFPAVEVPAEPFYLLDLVSKQESIS